MNQTSLNAALAHSAPEAAPSDEPEATDVDVEEPEEAIVDAQEGDEPEIDETAKGDDEPGEEFEEVEYEGRTYEVPKPLKAAILREADYTRKMQSLADERRAHEESTTSTTQMLQLREQNFELAAGIMAVDRQLEQFKQLDWAAIQNEDPEQFQRLRFQRETLMERRSELNTELHENTQAGLTAQRAQLAKAAEDTRKAMTAKYPDWSPDLEEEMAQYAISKGVNERQLRTTVDRSVLEILYDAYQYNKIKQAKTAASARPKPTNPEPVAPANRVRTRRSASQAKSPERMSTEEWMAWRNKQARAS